MNSTAERLSEIPVPQRATARARKVDGSENVAIVTRFFRDQWGRKVENVEGDPEYENIDVDLRVESRDGGLPTLVEVKGDTRAHETGNIIIETISNLEKQTPGWILYSGAAVLAYSIAGSGEMLLLPMPALRTWALEHAREWPVFTTETQIDFKDREKYTTCGRKVPVHVLVEAMRQTGHEKVIFNTRKSVLATIPGKTVAQRRASMLTPGLGYAYTDHIAQVEDALFTACRNGGIKDRRNSLRGRNTQPLASHDRAAKASL